ncbi:MAG: Mur ligase domain-containing protein, partial [Planctomycetota bacterium]
MRLSHLRDVLPEADFIDFEDVPITGVANDSRRVKPGHLFVAVPGYKEDGLRFVVDALGRGCVAVLTDRRAHGLPRVPQVVVPDVRRALAHVASHFYRNPSSALTVVGVTGTKGKTTTTYLVRSMFEAAGG